MGQILIYHADNSIDFRKAFSRAISQTEDMLLLGSVADGAQAERAMRETPPDVLVVSLALQTLDGIELIERVQRFSQRPRIIVVSSLMRDFCIEEAMRHGADYFMPKPCTLSLLIARIRELAAVDQDAIYGAADMVSDPEPQLKLLLGRIGVAPELSGFRYMTDAVCLSLLQERVSVTKDIYPQIALTYHVTVSSVERAIRHAIAYAWRSPVCRARDLLFPDRMRPSNSRFIQRLATLLRSAIPPDALR